MFIFSQNAPEIFRAAVHKPMGDVTDVTSISYIQSMLIAQVSKGLLMPIYIRRYRVITFARGVKEGNIIIIMMTNSGLDHEFANIKTSWA